MKKTNNYFGDKEEQAVIKYITTNSRYLKNKLYNEILEKPFRIMNQSILRRYPIHIGNHELEELEHYALTHLIEQMVKYRPFIIEKREIQPPSDNDYADSSELVDDNKWVKMDVDYRFFDREEATQKVEELSNLDNSNEYRIFYSRSYSYCQTIIRNYYKDHSKDSYNDKKINLCYDDYASDLENISDIDDNYDGEHKIEILISNIVDAMENEIFLNKNLKKNEIIVGEAIINVLKNWNVLFMEDTQFGSYDKLISNKYAKNKVLLMLNEQTGLNTKEIRLNMKSFKEIYDFETLNMILDNE